MILWPVLVLDLHHLMSSELLWMVPSLRTFLGWWLLEYHQASPTDCTSRCLLIFRCVSCTGCISKARLYATWLMGVSAVIRARQLAACCISCVVLHVSFISVMVHLVCGFGGTFPLQPGQQSSCACCMYRPWFLVYSSMHSRAGVQAGP